MSVRVRFAPSPTGFLHIGGARTALFNWLYARHTGGTFILRIEDTDAARNSTEAVEVILDGLRWLGLDWDEGPVTGDPAGERRGKFGPYFQSQRSQVYQKRVEELKSKGLAYDSEGAVKFRMDQNAIVMHDLVVGEVTRELTDREQLDPDFVIVRSDGQPVFHLVNVIDDLEMGITHVIRGEDHLSNTPKHIALFRAFGTEPPAYAHIPLILNHDGTKMSKRDQGASLHSYRDEGYAPEAMVNYLCLLGWSPKENREMLPLQEVVQLFDLPQILRHNARFDLNKLQWLNAEYLKSMAPERFTRLALPSLARKEVKVEEFPESYVVAALATSQGKAKLFTEVPAFTDFYFTDRVVFETGVEEELRRADRDALKSLREVYATLEPFTAAGLEAALKNLAKERGIKAGVVIHPLRMTCTGRSIGPSLYHLMEVLGRERVLARLDRVLQMG